MYYKCWLELKPLCYSDSVEYPNGLDEVKNCLLKVFFLKIFVDFFINSSKLFFLQRINFYLPMTIVTSVTLVHATSEAHLWSNQTDQLSTFSVRSRTCIYPLQHPFHSASKSVTNLSPNKQFHNPIKTISLTLQPLCALTHERRQVR